MGTMLSLAEISFQKIPNAGGGAPLRQLDLRILYSHSHVSRLIQVDREGLSCIYDTNTQTTGGLSVETDRQQLYTGTVRRASHTEHS